MDFGKVGVGLKKSTTATLQAGDAAIKVSSADWSGPGFSVSGIVFPLTLSPGEIVQLRVTFAPQSYGDAAGRIKFDSNAQNSAQASLAGSGGQPHRVTLSWSSGSTSAVGYNIYRAARSKGPFTRVNSALHQTATFTDTTVQAGVTYFYVATSVDRTGKESRFSSPVRVMIPNS